MPRLVSRLLLTMLIVPAGILAYLLVFMLLESNRFVDMRDERALLAAGVATWLFVIASWHLAWRGAVRWTRQRRVAMVLTVVASAAAGVIVGLLLGANLRYNADFAYFAGSVVPPLLWLGGAIWVAAETDAERSERVTGRSLSLACPKCGYNLSGLTHLRCPECGSVFTLDALASGPAELELGAKSKENGRAAVGRAS